MFWNVVREKERGSCAFVLWVECFMFGATLAFGGGARRLTIVFLASLNKTPAILQCVHLRLPGTRMSALRIFFRYL